MVTLDSDVLRRTAAVCYVLFGSVLLVSCSSLVREQQDGPPSRYVDVSQIPNAQPAPVSRTRAGNAGRYTVLGKTYQTLNDSRGYSERGVASWYGTKFHGRRTANGEVYDMYAMTAAHKTLPIPSYVRVTHVGNGRSIIVKINDRGPFHDNRIIDLSYVAARKLGVDATGTALVDVVDVTPNSSDRPDYSTFVPSAPSKPSSEVNRSSWFIQLGAFSQRDKAVSLRARVSNILMEAVNVVRGDDNLHRVIVGPIADQQQIPVLQRSLRQRGLESGYVTRKYFAGTLK